MSSISGVMNGRIVPRGPEPAGEDADDDEKIFLSANFLRGASVRKLSNLLSAASEVAPSTTGGSDLRDGQKPDVRFLISTGDLVAHNLEAATKNATLVRLARFAIVRDVSKQIRAALEVGGRPQIPFVQVIGNNDLDGDYAIPFTEEEREWYLELYNAMKGFSIPEDDEEIKKDFLKGGYYSQRVVEASGDQGGEGVLPGSQRSGLRVISLNTNYWSTTAWKKKQMEPPEDPEDQFEWLEGTLRRAQEAGESVIIAGHVPPGFNAVFKIGVDFEVQFLPKYQKRLTDILKKFKEIVVAGIFGHYHRDSLRIILETEGTPNSKALIPIILGGSLTPQSGNNPTWRLFSYSPSAVTFQNAFQFFSDLFSFGILGSYNPPDTQDVTTLDRSANEEPQTEDNDDLGPSKMGPSWELEYEFRRTYETPDMSAASVQKAIEMALSQSSHYRTFVDREEAQPSSPDFLKACMLTSLSLETMTECVKNALPDPSLADTPNRAVAGRRQKKKTFPATTRRVFPVATAKSVNKSKRSWKVSQKTPQTVY
uniref:Calcineurin-like phosphoesterase domain-containing protein n=1 Tax=Chromera velia CCMP2878 TaxID=1169474 RepID=A0A0G4HPA3_9ALVE|eukprot:Cvel_7771.t1-p1 / transcript=Cvel_7771.t1 / gene=Cvel_7771 / organism=Chromera_velia_CCMP2878 / gene_product=Sphingomyelinase phosphodiesterase D, putative / transcript_product=Sphingomyelinase phosphodiesterase D, putative / location=Cvel_scaffold414:23329-27961(-) / protein_length=538 / sequence_SO=supercontig / SO=protein_coding / is_pseudo=false